jgi:lysozyme
MVDWAKANAGGVEWMITKATEGVSHVDKTLFAHTNAARGHCLVGAYHFFHASMDGAKQAELYLKAISTLPYRLDLPHCLDWESSSADGMSSAHQQREALAWLNKVESAAGRVPIIYGGEAFLRELKLPESFARYPLWLAHYGTTEEKLKIPAPWKRLFAWQYTDAETVPGLAKGHHVDANWFFGSVDDLKAIGRDS